MMKKRRIYHILAMLVLIAALSGCTKNDDGGAGATSPTDMSTPAPATPMPPPQPVTELTLCGIPVVSSSQPTGIGYKGTDYADGVLTLENVDMLAEVGIYPVIEFSGDLEIVLVGENRITSENDLSAIVGGLTGDTGRSKLTISGDGSLVIEVAGAAGSGIECSGNVLITGGAIEISGADAAVSGYTGEGEQLVFSEGFGFTGEQTDTRVSIGPVE